MVSSRQTAILLSPRISNKSLSLKGERDFGFADFGEYDQLTKTISLNKRYFNSISDWKKGKQYLKGMIAEHPLEILEHEIGHAIHYSSQELLDIAGGIYENLSTNFLSRYAMTNQYELVAEAFLAYRKYGRLPKELKAFEVFFDEIL